eukprot:scaffold270219_cov40-Tisochrysis_lutea.AAC.3
MTTTSTHLTRKRNAHNTSTTSRKPEVFEHADFLDSWATIIQHASSLLEKAKSSPVPSARGQATTIHATTWQASKHRGETKVSENEKGRAAGAGEEREECGSADFASPRTGDSTIIAPRLRL